MRHRRIRRNVWYTPYNINDMLCTKKPIKRFHCEFDRLRYWRVYYSSTIVHRQSVHSILSKWKSVFSIPNFENQPWVLHCSQRFKFTYLSSKLCVRTIRTCSYVYVCSREKKYLLFGFKIPTIGVFIAYSSHVFGPKH